MIGVPPVPGPRNFTFHSVFLLFALVCVLLPSFVRSETISPASSEAAAGWPELVRRDLVGAEAAAREALNRNRDDGRAVVCLITSLKAQGRLPEAEELFGEQLAVGTRNPLTLLGVGVIALSKREFGKAESLLTVSRDLLQERTDSANELVALERLGATLERSGRPEEARESLQAAAEIAADLDLPMSKTLLDIQLGNVHAILGDHENARVHFLRASADAQSLGLPLWEGYAAEPLGTLARARLDLDEALFYRKAAVDAYERGGSEVGHLRSLHYLANLYAFRGELSRSLSLLSEALSRAREMEYQREIGTCLADLGALSYLIGDYNRAIEQIEEAVDVFGDQIRPVHLSGYLSNIGMIQAEQSRYEDAFASFEAASGAVERSVEKRNKATVLRNIGKCLCEMGQTGAGVDTLERAIEVAVSSGDTLARAHSFTDLADCYLKEGHLDRAAEALALAEPIARASGYFQIEESVAAKLGEVARERGEFAAALAHFETAMSVAEGVRKRSAGATTLQSEYFQSRAEYYQDAVAMLYRLDRLHPEKDHAAEAFEVAQRAKARAFSDLLAEAEVDLRLRADPSYRAEEAELLREIAVLGQSGDETGSAATELAIDRLEDELLVLESELRMKDPRYAEIRYPRPHSVDFIQSDILREGDLLLEFVLGEEASYLWAVSKGASRFIELPSREKIEAETSAVLPMLTDYNLLGQSPAYFVAPMEKLSRTLLGPIEEELQDASRLIVAPDGILFYLPFEALFREPLNQATRPSFGSLPYLVMSHEVSYTPSIGVLTQLRATAIEAQQDPKRERTEEAVPAVLLIGDPIVAAGADPEVFFLDAAIDRTAAVPSAAAELQALESIFGGAATARLTGSAATLSAIRERTSASHFSLVHFATHGIYNEMRPRFSGLRLSAEPETSDDGFLTVGEVFALDLECDQIVLSACSSALGERVSGEGLVGLTRAFFYAGARSVVAALWDVSGPETAGLMAQFYTGFEPQSRGDRGSALAEAKRRMIRGEISPETALGGIRGGSSIDSGRAPASDLAHPYFWAAFVLSGDPR